MFEISRFLRCAEFTFPRAGVKRFRENVIASRAVYGKNGLADVTVSGCLRDEIPEDTPASGVREVEKVTAQEVAGMGRDEIEKTCFPFGLPIAGANRLVDCQW